MDLGDDDVAPVHPRNHAFWNHSDSPNDEFRAAIRRYSGGEQLEHQEALFDTIKTGKDAVFKVRTGAGKTSAIAALSMASGEGEFFSGLRVVMILPFVAQCEVLFYQRLPEDARAKACRCFGSQAGAGLQEALNKTGSDAKSLLVATPDSFYYQRNTILASRFWCDAEALLVVLDEIDVQLLSGFRPVLMESLGVVQTCRDERLQVLYLSATGSVQLVDHLRTLHCIGRPELDVVAAGPQGMEMCAKNLLRIHYLGNLESRETRFEQRAAAVSDVIVARVKEQPNRVARGVILVFMRQFYASSNQRYEPSPTRQALEAKLHGLHLNVRLLHAAMSDSERQETLRAMDTFACDVVLATAIAYRIDSRNVGLIVHDHVPAFVEDLIQSFGREWSRHDKSKPPAALHVIIGPSDAQIIFFGPLTQHAKDRSKLETDSLRAHGNLLRAHLLGGDAAQCLVAGWHELETGHTCVRAGCTCMVCSRIKVVEFDSWHLERAYTLLCQAVADLRELTVAHRFVTADLVAYWLCASAQLNKHDWATRVLVSPDASNRLTMTYGAGKNGLTIPGWRTVFAECCAVGLISIDTQEGVDLTPAGHVFLDTKTRQEAVQHAAAAAGEEPAVRLEHTVPCRERSLGLLNNLALASCSVADDEPPLLSIRDLTAQKGAVQAMVPKASAALQTISVNRTLTTAVRLALDLAGVEVVPAFHLEANSPLYNPFPTDGQSLKIYVVNTNEQVLLDRRVCRETAQCSLGEQNVSESVKKQVYQQMASHNSLTQYFANASSEQFQVRLFRCNGGRRCTALDGATVHYTQVCSTIEVPRAYRHQCPTHKCRLEAFACGARVLELYAPSVCIVFSLEHHSHPHFAINEVPPRVQQLVADAMAAKPLAQRSASGLGLISVPGPDGATRQVSPGDLCPALLNDDRLQSILRAKIGNRPDEFSAAIDWMSSDACNPKYFMGIEERDNGEKVMMLGIEAQFCHVLEESTRQLECDVTFKVFRPQPNSNQRYLFNIATVLNNGAVNVSRFILDGQDRQHFDAAFRLFIMAGARALFTEHSAHDVHAKPPRQAIERFVDHIDSFIFDFQYAEHLGLCDALRFFLGHERGEQMWVRLLRGCRVHWNRIVKRNSMKLPEGPQREIFKVIAYNIGAVPSDDDAFALLDIIQGARTEVDIAALLAILPHELEAISRLCNGQVVALAVQDSWARIFSRWLVHVKSRRMIEILRGPEDLVCAQGTASTNHVEAINGSSWTKGVKLLATNSRFKSASYIVEDLHKDDKLTWQKIAPPQDGVPRPRMSYRNAGSKISSQNAAQSKRVESSASIVSQTEKRVKAKQSSRGQGTEFCTCSATDCSTGRCSCVQQKKPCTDKCHPSKATCNNRADATDGAQKQ